MSLSLFVVCLIHPELYNSAESELMHNSLGLALRSKPVGMRSWWCLTMRWHVCEHWSD